MFLKPKKVKTTKSFITRSGEVKVTKNHIDQLNRKIVEDCRKKEQQNTYHKGYNK